MILSTEDAAIATPAIARCEGAGYVAETIERRHANLRIQHAEQWMRDTLGIGPTRVILQATRRAFGGTGQIARGGRGLSSLGADSWFSGSEVSSHSHTMRCARLTSRERRLLRGQARAPTHQSAAGMQQAWVRTAPFGAGPACVPMRSRLVRRFVVVRPYAMTAERSSA